MITQEVVLAIVVALTGWWFSTGLILFLVHRNASLHGRLFVVATGIMLLVLMSVPAFAVVASPVNTVIGFCLALLLWGWLEMGYLMGFVTGPNRKPCPPHASLFARLRLGVGTCLWHELWLLLLVGSLYILTYEQPNQTTLWTFTALWLLRWSAKLWRPLRYGPPLREAGSPLPFRTSLRGAIRRGTIPINGRKFWMLMLLNSF